MHNAHRAVVAPPPIVKTKQSRKEEKRSKKNKQHPKRGGGGGDMVVPEILIEGHKYDEEKDKSAKATRRTSLLGYPNKGFIASKYNCILMLLKAVLKQNIQQIFKITYDRYHARIMQRSCLKYFFFRKSMFLHNVM